MAVDSNGNPIHFLIHDGTRHDVKVAPTLIDQIDLKETDVLCANKGYNSEALREQIEKNSNQDKYSKEIKYTIEQ